MSEKQNAVALRPEQSAPSLSIAQVFEAVLEKNISPENITVMKELLAMSAQQQFAKAFVALQAELPTIVAETVIPNRGKYARFEDVMHQVAPILKKHGFTVSFSQAQETGRVISTCHLQHEAGHVRDSSFAVRVSGKADSETQADCKAATTAKRKALQDALNIVIRQDCLNEEEDASLEGGNITEDQAFDLERRVALLNQDHSKFLKWLQVKSYAEIPTSKYEMADRFLAKKEQGQ